MYHFTLFTRSGFIDFEFNFKNPLYICNIFTTVHTSQEGVLYDTESVKQEGRGNLNTFV